MFDYYRKSGKIPEMPDVPSYTPKELEVLKSAITECGINYVDVIRAAQTESGKLALLTRANTGQLKSLVATSSTQSAFKRLREKPKAVVHVAEGVGKQVLLDDKLSHQTTVAHTPEVFYKKMKEKKSKRDTNLSGEEPKYRSADICTIQLGVTSHLSGHSNQVAGVVLLDGNRASQEQAVLGIGVLPLYEAHSHALFVPRLNISYEDKNFLNRLQLLTTFSDDVLGQGSPAMSYSTVSVVRHNEADAHFLPDPLPYSRLKEKYPYGVKGLSNFQTIEVAPLVPAKLTRTSSYVPLARGGSKVVLNFEDKGAVIGSSSFLPARASFSFNGISYGNSSLETGGSIASSSKQCSVHFRSGCPCSQHGAKFVPSGPDESLVPLASAGTESNFLMPASVQHPTDSKFVGSHPFVIPVNSNVGTIFASVPVSTEMLRDTEWGRFFKNYRYLRVKPTVRLVGSASVFAKGLLWLCYDPCGTLEAYPSRDRALMLQGEWFMPGRHDSVSLTIDEPATAGGTCDMADMVNGVFNVVVIKSLENFETTDYGMELTAYLAVDKIGMQLAITGSPKGFLPLRHLAVDFDLSTTLTKGKAIIMPINPLLPAYDGAQFYPSCSSSVFENHCFWKGTLLLEVIFSMPAACGGTAEIGFTDIYKDGAEGDIYRRYGSSVIDLRAHRIVRVKIPMVSAGGMCQAGMGSIMGVDQDPLLQNTLKLAVLFTAPPQLYDKTKKGALLIRYLGLEDWEFDDPIVGFNRFGEKPSANTPVVASGPSLIHGVGEWSEPPGCIVPACLKQQFFRVATITSWTNGQCLFFPMVPMCWFPKSEGAFICEQDFMNALSHRSQENALWRGKLEYFLSVRYYDAKPWNPVSMAACTTYRIFEKPSWVLKDKLNLIPALSPRSIFDATNNESFASVETPPGRWYYTHWHGRENYTTRTCPRWLLIQFPKDNPGDLNVQDITIWVKPTIEYAHPVGGFPLTKTGDKEPEYFFEHTFQVS